MQFKVGDIVQFNPAMRDQVTSNTWEKLCGKPLRIEEILEFGMFKAYMYTDSCGGIVLGRNDAFIPWKTQEPMVEELI